MYAIQFSGGLLKQFGTSYVRSRTRLASSFGRPESPGRFREYRKRFAVWLKEQSGQVAEACARQFEFVAAQRIRRSVQMFHLYTRIWDEVALREFIKAWRNRAFKNTRHFLVSGIGVTVYNWERERIGPEELNSCKQEIEGVRRLRDSTVVCAKCHLRIVVDVRLPGVKYCACYGNRYNATLDRDQDGWRPYIERQDMLIWRREEPDSGGLFAYKVYCSFADVTAEDFLRTQIDVDYRKMWDPTARELRIIDTDPQSQKSVDDSADIIYWETIWPRLFANRDYVYQRRWLVDREKRLIVIVSRVTEHPSAPTKPGVYRVSTYRSYMVIRPYTEFHQPGIEFSLTYFDDPGANIPSAVTSWVAMTGLPDFLIRMRQASKNYQSYKAMKGAENAVDAGRVSSRDEDAAASNLELRNGGEAMEEVETPNEIVRDPSGTSTFSETRLESDSGDSEVDSETSTPGKGRGLLRYCFLTKLFV